MQTTGGRQGWDLVTLKDAAKPLKKPIFHLMI